MKTLLFHLKLLMKNLELHLLVKDAEQRKKVLKQVLKIPL